MLTPDTIQIGTGFRAVIRDDGRIVWACPHVHFTVHSAKNCAERNVDAGVVEASAEGEVRGASAPAR